MTEINSNAHTFCSWDKISVILDRIWSVARSKWSENTLRRMLCWSVNEKTRLSFKRCTGLGSGWRCCCWRSSLRLVISQPSLLVTLSRASVNSNIHFRALTNHFPRQCKFSCKRVIGCHGRRSGRIAARLLIFLARFVHSLFNEEVAFGVGKKMTIDWVSKLFDCGLRFVQADLESCLLQCDDSPFLVYMDEMASFVKRLKASVATWMRISNEFIAACDWRS